MNAPTQQDINEMSNWMNVMEGNAAPQIHNPRVTAHINQNVGLPAEVDTVAAMKGVLGGFYDAVGDLFSDAPAAPATPVQQPVQQTIWADDDGMDYNTYLRQQNSQYNAPRVQPVAQYQYQATVNSTWEVVAEQYNGSKSLNTYSIVDRATRKTILNNIMMKECAFALRNLLNEGKTFDSAQMLGIISSGIRYTKEVKRVFENLKQRGACLRESNYQGAASLDSKIQSNKAEAKNIRDELVSFLNTNKISYK